MDKRVNRRIKRKAAQAKPQTVQEAWDNLFDAIMNDPAWKARSFCLFTDHNYVGIHEVKGRLYTASANSGGAGEVISTKSYKLR